MWNKKFRFTNKLLLSWIVISNSGFFRCINWDFEPQKLATKIDFDLYTNNIYKVTKSVWIFLMKKIIILSVVSSFNVFVSVLTNKLTEKATKYNDRNDRWLHILQLLWSCLFVSFTTPWLLCFVRSPARPILGVAYTPKFKKVRFCTLKDRGGVYLYTSSTCTPENTVNNWKQLF